MRGRYLNSEEKFVDTSVRSFYMPINNYSYQMNAYDSYGGYYIDLDDYTNYVYVAKPSGYHPYMSGDGESRVEYFNLTNDNEIWESPLSNEFTFSSWIRVREPYDDSYSSYSFELVLYDENFDTNDVFRDINITFYSNNFLTISTGNNMTERYNYSFNEWHHVGVVYLNNHTSRFYVNGKILPILLNGDKRSNPCNNLSMFSGCISSNVDICEISIYKGVKYGPNFTPIPTSPTLPPINI